MLALLSHSFNHYETRIDATDEVEQPTKITHTRDLPNTDTRESNFFPKHKEKGTCRKIRFQVAGGVKEKRVEILDFALPFI